MVVSIVVRTKIAKFGPGQFKFVLAKTEIAVFGPGQHHPARGGERFRRIFARARAPELRPKSWTKKDRVLKRNENYPKYVQAMRLMDAGKLPYTVAKDLHMGIDTIKRIRRRYLTGGELALLSPAYTPHLAAEKKEEILLSIQEKGLSLQQAAVEYGISKQSLRCWRKAYKQSGLAGLSRSCSEKAMGKKRQRTEEELDELEVLRKRNEYLEAENALLKKVKALVEEREARLRAIGQKPSKN